MDGNAFTEERAQSRRPHDPARLRRWTTFVLSELLFDHPGDSARLSPIREAVARGDDLGSRSIFPLHLTGSAIALDPSGTRVAMVEHAALGRPLQPGGHLEPGELPPAAAARELLEETGLSGGRIHFPGGAIDVDVHPIPANQAKGEPAHLHADFAYVFETAGSPLAGEAGAAASWRTLDEYAACDARSARIAKRLKWGRRL